MLTEDQVVDAVCVHLASLGWTVHERATLTQRGDDIVALKGDRRLVIEAKGAGSARPGSARYGQFFNAGQVFDHVAKAVLKALRVVERGGSGGVALPDDNRHRREIQAVRQTLRTLGIGVFWVREDHTVSLDAEWRL